jgi:uncharacterized protein YkwD
VDAALEEAALRLATQAHDVADTALRDIVREVGGTMPSVRALRVGLDADADAEVARWLSALRATAEGPVVCAEVEGDAGRIVLAAERAGALRIERVEGEPVRVRAEVAAGFVAQYVVFRGADGRFVRVAATRALEAGEPVPESLPLPIDVQLVAEARRGPRPVAELTIGASDESVSARATGAIARRRGDEEVPARVMRLREEASVSSLRPNRLLDEAARVYAAEVCAAGRVVHRSVTGDGPRERLRMRGIDARVVGETIARATSRAEALAALEGSASHLATLVDRRFTDGGYGMASGRDGRRCVVIVLAAWPRTIAGR